MSTTGYLESQRAKPLRDDKLERSLIIFVHQARENHLALSGSIIREKACQFGKDLGITNFKGSNGCLVKFLKRQKMSFKKLCGKSASVDTAVTSEWQKNVLPGLVENYEPRDIFNADETGLFYNRENQETTLLQEC